MENNLSYESLLSIDETSPSNGELYTVLTNKDAKGGKGIHTDIILSPHDKLNIWYMFSF